uniref:Uncharacterized protein n=1 Tax=Lepeophtheirus salmonis TaxID=72036 RepID=A0A0K2TC27_LEPSM
MMFDFRHTFNFDVIVDE